MPRSEPTHIGFGMPSPSRPKNKAGKHTSLRTCAYYTPYIGVHTFEDRKKEGGGGESERAPSLREGEQKGLTCYVALVFSAASQQCVVIPSANIVEVGMYSKWVHHPGLSDKVGGGQLEFET